MGVERKLTGSFPTLSSYWQRKTKGKDLRGYSRSRSCAVAGGGCLESPFPAGATADVRVKVPGTVCQGDRDGSLGPSALDLGLQKAHTRLKNIIGSNPAFIFLFL